MSLYFLQSNGARSVIHTEFVSERRVVDGVTQEVNFETRSAGVEASSWLAAKEALGFDLTPLQKFLLSQQRQADPPP